MQLSKDKLEKISALNGDFSELVLKLNEYISQEYGLLMPQSLKNNLKDILDKNEKNFFILFTSQNICEANNILKVSSEGLKPQDISGVENIKFIIDVQDVSFLVIWKTHMRRKIYSLFEKINAENIDNINEQWLKKALFEAKVSDISKDKKYDLDILMATFKEIFKLKEFSVADVLFINVSEDVTERNKDIFFINEFQKFITALSLKEKKHKYIYETICNDMDTMFSKYGFCNFKKNKCFSQRHKSISNMYPVPNTDGCCFKIIKKCEHNNKDGTCKIKCLPCKLYTCPYLYKCGIGLLASELILIRAFLNNKQKGDSINSFFESEEQILKKWGKHSNHNLPK